MRAICVPLLALVAALACVGSVSAGEGKATRSLIAFARPDGNVPLSIFTANPDGSRLRQLTPSMYDGWPAWSPDGKKIVFIASASPNWDIDVMNAGGTGIRRLARNGIGPSWSPDGRKIAFWNQEKRPSGIYVMNADGSQRHLLAAIGGSPSWSPDAKKILYVRNAGQKAPAGMYVMNADGTGSHLLRKGFGSPLSTVRWSPDGTRIAALHGAHIWVMNADGSGQRRLARSFVPFKMSDCSFAWSPDGTQIAFTPKRKGGVYLLTVKTGALREVPGTAPACGASWARP